MVVVADSSPFIVLIHIDQVDILPKLFGQVVVPPEVAAELRHFNRPVPVQDFIARHPTWLLEQAPATVESIPMLHAGEMAAISLARELKADLLLIDDMAGRKAATDRQIPITGTIGVLELVADQSFLELSDAFERVKRTDFWISHELLDARLRLYLARKGPPK